LFGRTDRAGAGALLPRHAVAADVVEAVPPPSGGGFRYRPPAALRLDPGHRDPCALRPGHAEHRSHLRAAAGGALLPRRGVRRAVRLRLPDEPRPDAAQAGLYGGPQPGPSDPLLLPRRRVQVLGSGPGPLSPDLPERG